MWRPPRRQPLPVRRPLRPRSAARNRPTHVPTPSEKAVHVREDVSKVFVIAAVAVFVAILLNGLLFGTGGLFTPIATPSPSPSAAPSASASAGRLGFAFGAGIGQPGGFGFGVGVGARVRGSVGIGLGVGAGLRRALGLTQPVGRSPAYPAFMGTEEGATDDHGPPTGEDGRRAAPGPRHPRRTRARGDDRDPA